MFFWYLQVYIWLQITNFRDVKMRWIYNERTFDVRNSYLISFFVEIFNRNTENTKTANFFCWKKRYHADVILNIRVNQALRWRDQRKSTHGLIGDGFNRDGRPGGTLIKKESDIFRIFIVFFKISCLNSSRLNKREKCKEGWKKNFVFTSLYCKINKQKSGWEKFKNRFFIKLN